ncbi:retroviral-like aspartic protease family protein [Oceanimonas baumannii]|uniref:retropepsin-like aspartic protease family protein n=1 Tax=Oceanimonas baumannii TaxID=129578 RepID=UPI001D1948B3|nr:retropepsin-like aspartic protease [Oceanimonas baumannii]MCC4264049.1 retroviral-like aspartic protease family protein [Oceanimonas baumannii]
MAQQHDPVRRTGRIMWILVWGLGLLLLTWYFNQRLDQQINPNQQVQVLDSGSMVLEQNRYGHYVASGTVNQQPVVFLLDTGATQMAVPQAVAARLELPVGHALVLRTAAGQVTGYRTHIKSLSLGPFTLYDLDAVIMPSQSEEVLLGMNALRRFELIQRGSQMTITYSGPEQ